MWSNMILCDVTLCYVADDMTIVHVLLKISNLGRQVYNGATGCRCQSIYAILSNPTHDICMYNVISVKEEGLSTEETFLTLF